LAHPTNEFKAHSAWPSRPSTGISICRGDLAAAGVELKQLRDLFRYMRRDISYAAKVRLAVSFIRAAASQSNVIGDSVLAIAIPGRGPTEAFDFSVSTGQQVKTMPHVVYASGSRVTPRPEMACDKRGLTTRWSGPGQLGDLG
jgi:hypothetical protein